MIGAKRLIPSSSGYHGVVIFWRASAFTFTSYNN